MPHSCNHLHSDDFDHGPTPFELGLVEAVRPVTVQLIGEALQSRGVTATDELIAGVAGVAGPLSIVATVRELQRRGLLPDYIDRPGQHP